MDGCLLLGSMHALLARPARADEPGVKLVVVVQKASPLTELSLRELKRLYVGEPVSDPAGNRIVPLNQPPASPERVSFDRFVLKMGPDEVGRFWIDRKIRGQTGAPRKVAPLELMRNAVATIPGTLAYMREGDVDARLRVLAVDGKRPSDSGYALQ
jgi:hypothetical protein